MDTNRKYLLETGIKSSWSVTTNYRTHDKSINQGNAIHQKNNIKWTELIVSPYISSTLRFNKQLWMRLGIRYVATKSNLQQLDKTDNHIPELHTRNNNFLPSFHSSYIPSLNHKLSLMFNTSIEHPKFKDLNPFVWQINEHSFYKGNISLYPQKYYTTTLEYTFANSLSIRGRAKKGIGIITPLSIMQDKKVYTQMENAQNNLFLAMEVGYYFDELS